jgi:HD-GYP domain-containing protein (c-di-GMP phosphodiesterase class II)
MPLYVPATEVQAGMKLHSPVLSNGRVMLQAGRPLTEADVRALQRRFPNAGVRIEDPLLDEIIEFEDDSRDRQIANDVRQRVSNSLSTVQERFSDRAFLGGADLEILQTAVHELLEHLRANRTTAAVLSECLDGDNHIATHAGNVFYLSILLASATLDYVAAENMRLTQLRYIPYTRASDLASLGLGAMLMDLGMLPLRYVYDPQHRLTEQDRQAIRLHPLTGAGALPESISPVARAVVRLHHENAAGLGYPARIPGDRILVFARIARIADAFDSAISSNVYKNALSPARALWEMSVGPYKRFFDPVLMETFARLIQPFPIGAKLRLRDGRYAVVVRYNRRNPFWPTIIVAFDSEGRPIPREQLRKPAPLDACRDLRVASFRGEDLSFIYSNLVEDAPSRDKFIVPLDAAFP